MLETLQAGSLRACSHWGAGTHCWCDPAVCAAGIWVPCCRKWVTHFDFSGGCSYPVRRWVGRGETHKERRIQEKREIVVGGRCTDNEASVISGPHFVAQPREISPNGGNTSGKTLRWSLIIIIPLCFFLQLIFQSHTEKKENVKCRHKFVFRDKQCTYVWGAMHIFICTGYRIGFGYLGVNLENTLRS